MYSYTNSLSRRWCKRRVTIHVYIHVHILTKGLILLNVSIWNFPSVLYSDESFSQPLEKCSKSTGADAKHLLLVARAALAVVVVVRRRSVLASIIALDSCSGAGLWCCIRCRFGFCFKPMSMLSSSMTRTIIFMLKSRWVRMMDGAERAEAWPAFSRLSFPGRHLNLRAHQSSKIENPKFMTMMKDWGPYPCIIVKAVNEIKRLLP